VTSRGLYNQDHPVSLTHLLKSPTCFTMPALRTLVVLGLLAVSGVFSATIRLERGPWIFVFFDDCFLIESKQL